MHTVHELREILSEQIDGLKANTTTIQRAQTMANLVGKFLHSIRLQLEYTKLRGTAHSTNIPALDMNSHH